MMIPDTSHATSKTFEKSGRCKTGASNIFCLISWKALVAPIDYLNSSLFKQSVIGAMIMLNPLITRR